MKHEIALGLLSTATYGTHTTTELVRASGHSPTTVVRYLNELEERGWMERLPAERPGVGRPPILRRPTDAGLAYLREAELGWFRKVSGNGVRILWGPVRALAFWGVPFMGRPDIFADRPIEAGPFPVLVERSLMFYEDAVEAEDGRFPALESLVAWAAKSGNPRHVGAAAILLRDPRLRVGRLVERSERMRTRNRVGFLAALSGGNLGFRPSPSKEKMLDTTVPVEPETEALARRWRVDNPISATLVKDMERLYGRSP